MSYLKVSLFGSMQVSLNQGEVDIRMTRSIQGLFAYLLLQRNRMHSRDRLASLFWSESTEAHARGCLNNAVWRLRRALESNGVRPGAYLVINHLGEIGFDPGSDYWLDVAEFEMPILALLTNSTGLVSAAEELAFEHAVELYRGDLLEGFYDDWALRERERLRALYLDGLAYMMRYYRRTDALEKGLICGQRIIAIDPLREEIHRAMMRLYLESGQRALALHQYEYCWQVLAEELGIQPMEETQAVYAQIIGQHTPALAAPPSADRQAMERLLKQLEKTVAAFDTAREQIQQLIVTVKETLK